MSIIVTLHQNLNVHNLFDKQIGGGGGGGGRHLSSVSAKMLSGNFLEMKYFMFRMFVLQIRPLGGWTRHGHCAPKFEHVHNLTGTRW